MESFELIAAVNCEVDDRREINSIFA